LTGSAEGVVDCDQEFIPESWLIAWLHSPATLHAYDENGNHLGLNETGEVENTIGEGAYYLDNSSEMEGQVIRIYGDKKIRFVVEGYEPGEITLDFIKVAANGSVVEKKFENVSVDEETQYVLDASSETPELVKQKSGADPYGCAPAMAIIGIAFCAVVFFFRSNAARMTR
jgi:hypothetical protein